MKPIRKLLLPLFFAAMTAVMIFALAIAASAENCPALTSVVWGDASRDKKVDTTDVSFMASYLANIDPSNEVDLLASSRALDANGDGEFNLIDLTILARYLADYNQTLGTSSVILGPESYGHTFNRKATTQKYLVNAATCTEPARYYYSCARCGEAGTETFSYGEPLGHHFIKEVIDDAYLASPATCTRAATYYYACTRCKEMCTEIFTHGEALGHDYDINHICTRCDENLYTISSDRKTVTFGSYPQSEVTDSSLNSTLTLLAGTLPTSSNAQKWTSYGCYINGGFDNYMWYQDVTYNDEKYRGVYFISYTPSYFDNDSSADNSHQDDNGYYINTVYWFKYEPLTWTVLSESDGTGFLLCNYIIDCQAYQNEYEYKNNAYYIKGTNTYANNYEQSTIRAWLNDTFYNTAFTVEQQAIIKITGVSNSARSTNPSSTIVFNKGVNTYACSNTADKIFLLSVQEATNSTYGFSSSYSYVTTARQKKASDYAQAQGAHPSSADSDYAGNCSWWLRSPGYGRSDSTRGISDSGGSLYGSMLFTDGVLPALNIIFD